MLGTIARAASVLELFVGESDDWGVTEVATHLGLPKSNAHDILSSLAHAGLLQRTEAGRYRLGWRLMTLTGTLVRNQGLHRCSVETVRELASSLAATVAVAVWDGEHVVRIARAGARHVGLVTADVGERVALATSAEGQVLLCCGDERDALRDPAGRPSRPQETPDLGLRGEQIRLAGAAEDVDGTWPGLSSVAVPVWSAAGDVMVAVSITVPTSRFHAERHLLRRAAQHGSRRMAARLRAAGSPPQPRDLRATACGA